MQYYDGAGENHTPCKSGNFKNLLYFSVFFSKKLDKIRIPFSFKIMYFCEQVQGLFLRSVQQNGSVRRLDETDSEIDGRFQSCRTRISASHSRRDPPLGDPTNHPDRGALQIVLCQDQESHSTG
jgi:hypothetical protein